MPETMQKSVAGLSTIDKLRMLLDITKTISRSLDLAEVLNLVMDTLDSLIPYDAAGIYILRSAKKVSELDPDDACVFRTEAVRGYDLDELTELQRKMGEGMIGHVALQAEHVISGDYYDWVRIHDDEIGIVVADVSGKGVPAALLMAFLRASLRAATHIGYSPHISMSKVNYLLWESIERNQFVTAFYGLLDASNRTLAYTNAGHNPPLLMDAEGNVRFID